MFATISDRHCEERSDEAIHASTWAGMDCFAALAMTGNTISVITTIKRRIP
jgi:hypothetical protein